MKKICILLLVCLLIVGCSAGKTVYRINCGAEKHYVDGSGNKWLADQALTEKTAWGVVGGSTVDRGLEKVADTAAPNVYSNECYSMDGYVFKLPEGKYTVKLHFAETFDGVTEAGGRVFDVTINEKVVIQNMDPFREAGGFEKPAVKVVKGVTPVKGKISIGFVAKEQNPEINGIEIITE